MLIKDGEYTVPLRQELLFTMSQFATVAALERLRKGGLGPTLPRIVTKSKCSLISVIIEMHSTVQGQYSPRSVQSKVSTVQKVSSPL